METIFMAVAIVVIALAARNVRIKAPILEFRNPTIKGNEREKGSLDESR